MLQLEEIPVESAKGDFVTIDGEPCRRMSVSNSRLSVRWRDFVIKVGDQSCFENERWQRLTPSDAHYFAPIVDAGMLNWVDRDRFGSVTARTAWVAQRFIQVRRLFPLGMREEVARAYATLEAVAKHNGVHDIELKETPKGFFAHNWTIFKGQPVIYDYGF